MADIFINYRKDDSQSDAYRLHNELIKYFNKNQLFIDSVSIEPGEDYLLAIEREIRNSKIFLALISKNWFLKDENGKIRLYKKDDILRYEIEKAINRPNVLVIPVILGKASMPLEKQLPEEIASFSKCQGFEIYYKHFESDVKDLSNFIKNKLRDLKKSSNINIRKLIEKQVNAGDYTVTEIVFDKRIGEDFTMKRIDE